MSIQINNTNIDKVVFNGTELTKVIYNGVTVWEAAVNSDYIIKCTPITITTDASSNTTKRFEFVYSTGETGGTISITNDSTFEPIEIAANSGGVIDLSACTIDDPIVKFAGGFTKVIPQEYESGSMSSLKSVSVKINKIISWLDTQTNGWDGQFSGAQFTDDITIPSRFSTITMSGLFRNDANLSQANLYFNANCPTIYCFSNVSGDTNRAYLMTADRLPKNTVAGTNAWAVNNVAIMASADGWQNNEIELIELPAGTTRLASGLINADTYIKKIIIPATVSKCDKNCLNYSSGTGKTLQFNHSKNATIDLPTETGDGKGMAYNKTARSITIITDNLTIKSYNWAGDNVTATFKHLDGTDWKLAKPVVTLTDSTISWDSVSNAAKYVITYTPAADGCANNIEVTSTSYDLSSLNLPDGTYSVQVKAIKAENDDEHDNSDASTAVSYTITTEEATDETN